MLKINYITNLLVDQFSGGWSGMNHNVYNQLKSRYEINLIENINPNYKLSDRAASKLGRAFGFRANFPAFTDERLNRIKGVVEDKIDSKAVLNFYHGSTPWVNVNNVLPYAAYLDASFATYIRVYHKMSEYSKTQLTSIFRKERSFLENAVAIFFSSEWSMSETKKYYDLDGSNFYAVGLGGAFQNISLRATPGKYFLFVGLDFRGKGGDKAVEAFRIFSKDYPTFKFKIVGERPTDEYIDEKIEYEGFINKSSKGGMKRMTELFSCAYCFVMPTQKDMTPLVLVEAGSAGCPVISVKNFGIPEIVKDGETGILINDDRPIIGELVKAMKTLCGNEELHKKMRKASIDYVQERFDWNKVGHAIYNVLNKKLQ